MSRIFGVISTCLGKDVKKWVLLFAMLFSFIVCIYSILTYGRTVLNSDAAIANTYADAVWKYHTLFPKTWNYANGDVWSLDLLVAVFAIIIHPFVTPSDFSRELVSSIQLIVAAVTTYLFFKKVLKNDGWTIAFPLETIFIFGVSQFVLYDACYGGYMIWLPIVIYCLIGMWNDGDVKYISKHVIILAILFGTFSIRGPRNIADFVLPSVLTLIFVLYITNREKDDIDWKKWFTNLFYFSGIFIIPTFIGYKFYRYIDATRQINDITTGGMVFPNSLSDLYKGLTKTISFYFMCFGYNKGATAISIDGLRNLVSLVLLVMICVVIPILQWVRLKEENVEVKILFYFTLFHNGIIFLSSVIFALTNHYHMTGSIVLFAIVSARYIYHYYIHNGKKLRSLCWISLFIVATLIQCIGTVKLSKDWRAVVEDRKRLANELLERGLTKGYTTFWNSYCTQMYSENKLNIAAVGVGDRLLYENRWLNDTNKYNVEDTKTFLMLTDEDMEAAEDIGLIVAVYDEPIEWFTIKDICLYDSAKYYNGDINVYVYADDYAKHLANGCDDGIITPHEMSFNNLGQKDDDRITIDKNGYVYGPYSTMTAGEYIVEYNGVGLSHGRLDILSEKVDGANKDQIKYEYLSQNDTNVKIRLKLKKRTEAMQFVVENVTDEPIEIDNIVIEKQ